MQALHIEWEKLTIHHPSIHHLVDVCVKFQLCMRGSSGPPSHESITCTATATWFALVLHSRATSTSNFPAKFQMYLTTSLATSPIMAQAVLICFDPQTADSHAGNFCLITKREHLPSIYHGIYSNNLYNLTINQRFIQRMYQGSFMDSKPS